MNRGRRISPSGVLALLGATLAATACDVHHRANTLRMALDAAPVCCPSPREFPFEPAAVEKRHDFTVGERSPAFAFSTGKSFFKGFALPATPRPAAATIVSYAIVEKASVNQWTGQYFSPIVIYYDENLEPSRPVEGVTTFLFDGKGRRFSALEVPVPPDARFMSIHADAGLLNATISIPVDFAVRDTKALTCGTVGQGTDAGRQDLARLTAAMCGMFTDTTVYAQPATREWEASIPYAAGGDLALWLSAPGEPVEVPASTR